eukprot:scaffold32301_cov135-Isochrysis_galbana.AAC.3
MPPTHGSSSAEDGRRATGGRGRETGRGRGRASTGRGGQQQQPHEQSVGGNEAGSKGGNAAAGRHT